MWFSNTFKGTSFNLDEALTIQFDDSYVEDRISKLEAMRADALSFPEIPVIKKWYIMEKYNISEEDAVKFIEEGIYTEENEEESED